MEAVLVETPLSGWEDMSSSTPLARRKNIEPEFGGASRDRTDDLIVATDALSQLSYSPTAGMLSSAILAALDSSDQVCQDAASRTSTGRAQ